MCLDSKLLAVAEMFPSWPHKNIPSPLEHHAPVEKCFLLWSYKRHLSITASGKPEREGKKRTNCLVFQGSFGPHVGHHQLLPEAVFQHVLYNRPDFMQEHPLLSRGEGRDPVTLSRCALAAPGKPLAQSCRGPALPAAEPWGQRERCFVFGAARFCLHRQRDAKRTPARRCSWWHRRRTAFGGPRLLRRAGAAPRLCLRGGLGASFAFQPPLRGPLLPLEIYLDANTRARCHRRCPSPAVCINKNLFWIKVVVPPPPSPSPRPLCARLFVSEGGMGESRL